MQSNNKSPTVSVFIPYYNDRKFLARAIESVLSQDFDNFELVLLNHATTDDCREIAHSYLDSRIVHIDYPSNLGAGSGFLVREFLQNCRGEFVKLFCADDEMKPDCLSKLVAYMRKNSDVDFAFGNVEYMAADGKLMGRYFFDERANFSLKNDAVKCLELLMDGISFLPYIGSFIRAQALNNIRLDGTYIMLFDVSLWASLLLNGKKIGYCNSVVADYRIHKEQMSYANVKNLELAIRRSNYENFAFEKLFFEMSDVDMARKVLKKDPYVDKIETLDDVKFVVAHHYLSVGALRGYEYIHDAMSDDVKRARLAEHFGYGIKEFREEYSQGGVRNKIRLNGFKGWKNRVYSSSPKELGAIALTYLVMRELWDLITLRKIFKRLKTKRGMTL